MPVRGRILQVRLLAGDDSGGLDSFVRDSKYGDVLQTTAWARLKAASGWRAHYLLVEDDGRTAGACLALERRLPGLPWTLLYCPRGPVLDWDSPAALEPLAIALKDLARERRAVLVKIDPPVRSAQAAAATAIRSAGFRPVGSDGFGGTQPKCVMKLDLTAGADAVFERFKPKWRYNVRLAERKGVTIREGGKDDVLAFYEILLETARRDRFLVRGRDYFTRMWDELGRDGLIRIFLGEYEGSLISGALMYVLGRQAWYTYGASSNEHRNVMPNHLMQWRMIQESLAAGCATYDFRGVSCNREEAEGDHLSGLNRFKAGFGAEFVEYAGEFDLPVNKAGYLLWTRAAPAAMRLLKRRARMMEAE